MVQTAPRQLYRAWVVVAALPTDTGLVFILKPSQPLTGLASPIWSRFTGHLHPTSLVPTTASSDINVSQLWIRLRQWN